MTSSIFVNSSKFVFFNSIIVNIETFGTFHTTSFVIKLLIFISMIWFTPYEITIITISYTNHDNRFFWLRFLELVDLLSLNIRTIHTSSTTLTINILLHHYMWSRFHGLATYLAYFLTNCIIKFFPFPIMIISPIST